MRTRLAALALTVPLALGALAGCAGDGDSSGTPGGSAAADPTDPSDPTEGEEISAEQLTDLLIAAFDAATTADVRMRMSVGGQEIEASGQADYTTDPVSLRLDLTGLGGAGDMTVVLVDATAYIRLPARGEDFVRLDLDDPANPLGGSLADQLDPRAQAEVIAAGLRTATHLGEEDVEGETLDHYTAVVDSAAMLEHLDLDPAAAGALPEEITYDLWFDAGGAYRRMSVDLGAAAGEVLVELDHWGTDVDIEAPPADQVTDLGRLAG